MDITLSQRRAAFNQVEAELRETLLSDETTEAVNQIAAKNTVSSAKLVWLSEEVANVLLGLRNPSDFIPALQRRLEISPTAAQAIANDINTQVFRPVRIPLLKMFGLGENGRPQQTTTQAPAASPAASPTAPITTPMPKPAPVAAPTPAPMPTPATQPVRIPVIVPPPGIGENKPATPSNTLSRPQSPQSQFVQYQPLKQNPFEMKPMPTPGSAAPQNQPLNPNTLNTSAPQVHTLKDDIKNMTIVQQKLQNVVSAPKKNIEWTKPEIKIGSTGTYTVDPYREPPQP